MTTWFENDDAGYLDWLESHSEGHVLNTTVPPSASYLVVHRASCRTMNRQLPAGRAWTRQYGKACAPTAADLVAWAREQAGGAAWGCGLGKPDL